MLLMRAGFQPKILMFFNPFARTNNGIYLPVSKTEENDVQRNERKKLFKRPLISILTMSFLLTIVVMIGLYVFIDSIGGQYAASMHVASEQVPPVILISIDGFRYDYLKLGITPNLMRLTKSGIHGPMKPQFPSYTFPNHYTLVTGLYPEVHGIVGNSFYDPNLDDYFSYTSQETLSHSKWWLAEPVWNTVQRFGMRSATMFWPGSESYIFGKRPNYVREYDEEVSTESRIEQVLKWLDLPKEKRPSFISMYMSVVDDAGHLFGPESNELKLALRNVDDGIGLLVKELHEREIFDKVNLMVVSDHGMVEIKNEESYHIYLDDMIPFMKDRLQWVDYGPMASIIPLKGEEKSVYEDLKRAQISGIPFEVYYKNDLPKEFQYSHSERIAPIILIAKNGWIIDYRGGNWVPRGAHGYDPKLPEMQALFIAVGPDFRTGKHVAGRIRNAHPLKGITNLDVYPLMMHLLKIPTPPPNNGTMALVNLIK
jgi:predicted AlkP superfamily pyrophosphatase or phosphodiesterase